MLKTTTPILLLLLFIGFTSCKKEMVNENGIPAGNNNKIVPVDSAFTGSFYENTTGSNYTYVDSTEAGTATVEKAAIKVLGDTSIDGVSFSKISYGESSDLNYFNSTGGVTKLVSFNGEDKVTSTILKANEPIGTVWTDYFSNDGLPGKYDWEIIAKGMSRTVLGVTYHNVIKVHMNGTAENDSKRKVAIADADYFYAPQIGLIESINYNTLTGKTELHRVLKSSTKQ